MPKSKVREEPTVKRHPEVSSSSYFNQLPPLDTRGCLKNIWGCKSTYTPCPYKPSRVTFLTRWRSAYALMQHKTDTETVKVKKNKVEMCFHPNELAL